MKVSEYTDRDFLDRYGRTPILHPYVVFPAILRLLGDIEGKRVLDLGCGSGDLSVLMAERGASVTGVDISDERIKICGERYGDIENPEFHTADGSDLRDMEDRSFDRVVMNMVLLNVPMDEKVRRIFREVSRVLADDGYLIFTDLNPICLMIPETSAETQSYPPDFSYFKDGSKYGSRVLLTDGSSIEFTDIHWTLESYTRWLEEAGMYIRRIIEPQPVDGAPEILKEYPIPEHIIFLCCKLARIP